LSLQAFLNVCSNFFIASKLPDSMDAPRSSFVRTEHFPFKTCGEPNCPICTKSAAAFKIKHLLNTTDFYGSTPAPFVGRFGYPNVSVGVLTPPMVDESVWMYDSPRYWGEKSFTIPQIVNFRSALINSNFKADIRTSNKMLDVAKEAGMAYKPVDLEVHLNKAPVFRLNLEPYVAPMGPTASLKSVEITSNPYIPVAVDKAVSDTDLKASDALYYLYKKNFDESYLTRLLSVGNLGIGSSRKLVPTRWAITATDDTVGKRMISEIKEYGTADYSVYFSGYLGNYFLIITLPEVWGYELFETMVQKNAQKLTYTNDYEFYDGRKSYAENCGGGYYASRLAVLEKLKNEKRQASVIVLRFITDEYTLPLGVWVVREATRKSAASEPVKFASRELLQSYVKDFVAKKFGVDALQLLENSKIWLNVKKQRKLSAFTS
jgi:DNA repair protein NreA